MESRRAFQFLYRAPIERVLKETFFFMHPKLNYLHRFFIVVYVLSPFVLRNFQAANGFIRITVQEPEIETR